MSKIFTVKIQGSAETLRNLQKIGADLAEYAKRAALHKIGEKILELSAKEVPLDEGTLLRSASVQDQWDDVLVGYNTAYAARLHFHPEYNFQNGRKAYYLTDPVKRNQGNLIILYDRLIQAKMESLDRTLSH